jgi:type II secretory pathway pseudopilin PulG
MPQNKKSRGGFTLVEVMIAATLSLVLVGLVVQIFATVGTTASNTRSIVQTADRLRTTRMILLHDLSNITAEMQPPLKSEAGKGYFEYLEGPDGPVFPGLMGTSATVAVDINQSSMAQNIYVADSTVGDPDDMLMFTAQAPAGTMFYGRMRAPATVIDTNTTPGPREWTVPTDTMAQSSTAEICYFMRGDTLYRRVLLLMPSSYWPNGKIDPNIFLWSQYPQFVGNSSLPQPIWDIAFYDKFDLSAHQSGGSFDISNSTGGTQPPMLVPNTLGDLTFRQNRYAHQPWVYPFDTRFWDSRFWTTPATNLPGGGGYLGLPTLRECTAYTGTGPGSPPPAFTTGNNGVGRWPFPLFDATSPMPFPGMQLQYLAGGSTTIPINGTVGAASGYLWGQPVAYNTSMTVPAWVQAPVYPYNTGLLPLIYPYPTSPPPGGTSANYQPVTTIPAGTWTGRINLTNSVNGGLFDLWSNPYPLDQQDYTQAPPTGALYAFSSAYQPAGDVNVNVSTRYSDDVLLTHVLSFDVKAWDPTAPTIQTNQTFGGIPAGTYMPGDPGYVQIFNAWATSGVPTLQSNLQPLQLTPAQPPGQYGGYGYVVAQGAYVDLNYLGAVIANFLSASPPIVAQALASVSHFAGPGVAQFGSTYSTGSGLAMCYDTGCFDYENDGIDQNQNGIIDEYTNGLDDNGIGGVDDITEVEGPVPYPVPLKGIQIKIRVYEPDSRQIREVTVTEDFLWE